MARLNGKTRLAIAAVIGGLFAAYLIIRGVPEPQPADLAAIQPAFLDLAALGGSQGQLLYGSQLGAWPMLDGRYDGQRMLDYNGSCQICPGLARDAHISVVRWGIWNVFDDMTPPAGQVAPPISRAQFDAVIDGIRGPLDALPLINLPPGGTAPANLFCPDIWGAANLLTLDQEIIRQAGPRVQLYELANEPELACGTARQDPSSAGSDAARTWTMLAPELRQTARGAGLKIYLGGPGFTTTRINPRNEDPGDVRMMRAYLQGIKQAYDDAHGAHFHDPDLIPSYISFHAYASEYLANGGVQAVDAIQHYAVYLTELRTTIDDVWGPTIGPRIRIACTEWNYAADGQVDWSSAEVPSYYTRFLKMLRDQNVVLATQFLVASNGNGMDMISVDGHPTPYYEAFKAASIAAQPVAH